MNRRTTIALGTTALLGFGLALSGSVVAQQKSLKEQITGTWAIVSNDNTAADGTKKQPFGPNPKGYMVLSSEGQYIQILTNLDRPKFKANSRIQGTPEENTAAVQATTATFGTWSADEGSKTFTVRTEGGMYPNQVGTESKRSVILAGDELKVSNPNPGSGGKAESVYKRVKGS
jgi:hypothetical protein